MAKRLKIDGYGQLELNQVAFRRTGRIEAQAKLHEDIEYVENGMLLAVDPATKTVNYAKTGDEFIALNYTTEHMYDERERGLKHFKLDKNTFLPRLGYIGTPDKFTTNTVCYEEGTNPADYKYGKACATEGFKGYIELTNEREGAYVEVLNGNATMPDGQKAVKFAGLN
jgi:hypothetical protein